MITFEKLQLVKLMGIDLSKQQKVNADQVAKQQISFTGNLERDGNVVHYWRSEKNHFRFFARNCESIVISFYFNITSK